MTSTADPEVTVRRPVYQQEELHRSCDYSKPKTRPLGELLSRGCSKLKPLKLLKKTVPILDWLPAYDWKNHILGDLVAGFTVAVMHIPQGMAYAILGNVPPIVGIYMAFFPVLVYFVFGTSRHNSMGTFALICMMTGNVIVTHSSPAKSLTNGTLVEVIDLSSAPENHYSSIEVGTAVCLTVAFIQLGMYVLRMGVISSLLAESLVSGFTTSAAIHVLTSQVKDLLGIYNLPRRIGVFKLIYHYIDIVNNFDAINIAAVIISSITILVLMFNEFLKPIVSKLCPFPVPIEMTIVVIGNLISMLMNLQDMYGIKTVGHIPIGLPEVATPPVSLVPEIFMDSLVITVVSYSISLSMALTFAQEGGYEIDANQELLAQGLGNLVGSFFSCMPFSVSLSRSLIQQTVGGRTQLASLVSCGILLGVLLYIGPFFESLPRSILAGVIIVALKGMIMRVAEFKKFWQTDKMDAAIWMITFLTVVFFDVQYGLLIGVLLCLGKLIIIAVRPYTCKLALAPGTELYLDAKRYKGTMEIPGVKIFHFSGSLMFVNRQLFRDEVYRITGIMPQAEIARRLNAAVKKARLTGTKKKEGCVNSAFVDNDKTSRQFSSNVGPSTDEKILVEASPLQVLILDFSALTYIDIPGVGALRNLICEYFDIDVCVYIVGCSGPVYETMRKCKLMECRKDRCIEMFPTVADAVEYIRHNENSFTLPPWNCVQQDETLSSRL